MGGTYVLRKKLPVIPGTVGCGRVVKAGSGFRARFLLGRKVSCAAPYDGDGTWAEYMVASAASCAPIRPGPDMERAANLLSNPLTAFGLFDTLREGDHHCFIQNAAAGDIARMVDTMATRNGIGVINIVRRPQQIEFLNSIGADHMLDSSDGGFEEALRRLCEELKPSALIDSVGGAGAELLGAGLAPGGEIVLCGKLSDESALLSQGFLTEHRLRVREFRIMDWARSISIFKTLRTLFRVQTFARDDWKPGSMNKVLPENVPGNVTELTRNSTKIRAFIRFY